MISHRTCLKRVLFLQACLSLWTLPASAIEVSFTTSSQTGSNVVSKNNNGYKTLFWNFTLPSSFTASDAIDAMRFMLDVNPPQGNNQQPLNFAVYNGFFDNGSNYVASGTTRGLPVGTSPTTPTNSSTSNDYQVTGTPTSSQLALVSWVPTFNIAFVQQQLLLPVSANFFPFNGTSPNALGQYSMVFWTENTSNFQIRDNGKLLFAIPGATSSSEPGVIDGTGNGGILVVQPGMLTPVPVPEPTTCALAALGIFIACQAIRRKRFERRAS